MINNKRRSNVPVQEIHDNTSQEIINITVDRLKLALVEHLGRVKVSGAWHMPLSLLIGVIVVFTTSTFKPAWGLSADAWSAFFALFGAGCLLWLVVTVFQAFGNSGKLTVDALINTIKNKTE